MNKFRLKRSIRIIEIFALLSFLISIVVMVGCAPDRTSNVTGEIGKEFVLLPSPQSINVIAGEGISVDKIKAFNFPEGVSRFPMSPILNRLPISDNSGKGVVTLKLTDEHVPESKEGYNLTISQEDIVISSSSPIGLFYGCQTLEQLIEDAVEQNVNIPFCEIIDFPGIPYRAIQIDTKHHLDNIKYYYDLIDWLSKYKINAIIWEFEDKLRYREYPMVGTANAISIPEMISISNYAKERNIEISPLIQGLGHAPFILKHEELKYLRDDPDRDWAFCPLNPDTYKVQFSLYKDAIDATPHGKYLHIGGDEVGKLGKSALSKKSGKTPFELQMYWLNKVSDYADRQGRIPIFWDDMILKSAGLYRSTYSRSLTESEIDKMWQENGSNLDDAVSLFPKNCVYMRWNYNYPQKVKGNHYILKWYKSNNLKAMAATSGQTQWPMMPRDESKMAHIRAFGQMAGQYDLDGILCTFWDDSSPHFETYRRGIAAFAEYSWSPESKVEIGQLKKHYRHRLYSSLASKEIYAFEDDLQQAVSFWDHVLLDSGNRISTEYQDFILMTLPNKKDPGGWSTKYEKRLIQAEVEIKRFEDITSSIEMLNKIARRNRFHLELMNRINELQIFSSKLLISLQNLDLAQGDQERNEAIQFVKAQVANFNVIRKNYERVFSKTRFLNKPSGYQLGLKKPNHIANATINSDWMYTYELLIVKNVNEMLTDW